MQILTADQKAKMAQLEAKHEARMAHMSKPHAASARGLTLKFLSYPGGNGTSNLRPRPAF